MNSSSLDKVSNAMTKEISHTFHFSCEPKVVADALLTENHIKNWWTKNASVQSGKGVFEWKGHGWKVALSIEESQRHRLVKWTCIASNMQNTDAWEGSTMTFELEPESTGSKLKFRHSEYKSSPCYDICHDGWRFVLGTSLKNYLETGSGLPYSIN